MVQLFLSLCRHDVRIHFPRLLIKVTENILHFFLSPEIKFFSIELSLFFDCLSEATCLYRVSS